MPEWVEIIIRTLATIVALFLITKGLGKKQLSEMNVFEYITGIVIGDIIAVHATDVDSNLFYGVIAAFLWFIIPWGAEYLSMKNKTLRDFIEGKSTVFIQNGKIMEDNLKKERYTIDELQEALRDKNIFRAADVEFAVLEPSGTLSVLPKKEYRPLTAKYLGIEVPPDKQPETVIMDGKVLHEPLANLSLNVNWLETELDKLNVSIENVFVGEVDSDGQLTVDLYDDKIAVPSPTEKPLLLATLKKCQADLELFALATENEQAKQLYQKNSKKLKSAITRITPYLK
ncbi:hypothetical protein GCM10011409_34040 [Lentibacillus populi]|uniref:YetF C-terminal domain-containing protein n=1 Tax=Lentibacillus populi TaxID=1827502 RepID=A0A9W5X6S5_9BACI|nr:DUF421 domain-containing protein [Lentibacillus populi]MBT2216237.1 DUF421 domain-containing protein [Virgibacillus dakarensis]GGB53603.1 hypothetical protein GCM10011409_34040 [Lentibacillus populi]